jgi:hypothetical protein
VVVEALHRERVESSCDVGRVPPELQADFPMLDFDHLPHEWWVNGGEVDTLGVPVESEAGCLLRVAAFRDWLHSRPEERIAVIGHATFFYHLTGKSFANCELHRLEF